MDFSIAVDGNPVCMRRNSLGQTNRNGHAHAGG
jgi:hypothetical protein